MTHLFKFLDVASKTTYSAGHGYVFQMGENGCSTGKWYSKNLVILTDVQNLTISIPEDSYFHLVDLSKEISPVEINSHNYADLSEIITSSIESIGKSIQTSLGEMYYHSFNVVFMSDTEGEFHDAFTVSYSEEGGNVDEVYEIAADVYMEDERLSIGLANEGIEIPEAFQRAVYPTNVRDESSDKLLLNRKWKELLIEYWNTVANKGSYNSLINSLKFFEYGDLVRIEEYWKQTDNFSIEELIGRDIEQILDPLVRQYLDVMSKTTYIGLYLTVNGLTKTSDDSIEYLPEMDGSHLDKFLSEPVPVLQELALKHSVEDLAMKMTLLANYFSTYFMPIHLDLIQSSIDKIVFSNTIKILRSIRFRREDWFDSLNPISCNLSIEKDYWMGNTRVFNYPDTVLRNSNVPTYWGDLNMLGVDPTVENRINFSEENLEEIKQYLNQYFGGVGAVVPIQIALESVRNFLKSVRISIYRETEKSNYDLTNTYLSEKPIFLDTIEFNLVFTKAGHYCIMLQAANVDGTDFAGSWYIDIHGSIGNLISVQRLKKIDYRDDQLGYDDWFYKNLDFNSFMFTEPFAEQVKYKQWLVPTDGSTVDGIGLNHLVVIDCGSMGVERPITITCNGEERTFQFSTNIAGQLSEVYDHYWWKLMVRDVAKKTSGALDLTGEKRYYIVGVRKAFDTEEPLNREIFSDYYKVYKDGELEDLEVVKVDYCATRSKTKRGYLIVTAPVGTEMWLDSANHFISVSQTTTIPLTKEKSVLHLRYHLENHLFSAEIEVPDTFTMYGQDTYKVHPNKVKGYTTIDTSRFFPIFHRLEELDSFTVSKEDTVVCIPNFRWVDKSVEDCYWEFVNTSTGETITSKSFGNSGKQDLYIQEPFVGKYDYLGSLIKGYYNVHLHFSMGGTEQVETVDSAFRIQ